MMISQSQDADKSPYGKNTDGGEYSKNVDDDKYEKNEKDVDDSSIINQIRYGLDAAQKYEQLKQQRRALSAQEDIHQMNISFPRLPESNAVTALLTEDEYVDLRFAMQNNASNITAVNVANVRQQLTEYHSLLDQLSSITTKYTVLQKTSQDQAAKIRSLEEELKRGSMQSVTNPSNIPRRISVDQPPFSFCQPAIQLPQLSGGGSSGGGYPPFLLQPQKAVMFSSRRRLPQEEVSVDKDSMKSSPRKQDQQLTSAATHDTSSIQCHSGYSPIRSAKRSISKEDGLSQVKDTKRLKSV